MLLAVFAVSAFNINAFSAGEATDAEDKSNVEFFVATDGSDENSGSMENPFATLQKAVDEAFKIKKADKTVGIVINIRGGDYFLTSGINLDSVLSGTAEKPFIIQSYNGEEVNLRGSKKINPKDFKKCTDTKMLSRIPEKARQHIGEYDLSDIFKGGLDMFSYPPAMGSAIAYYSLIINDREQTLARWPNDGYSHVVRTTNKYNIYVEPENAKRWLSAEEPLVSGFFGVQYLREYEAISKVNPDGFIPLKTNGYYGIKPGDRYYILNLIEELDSPGEYYIDRVNKKLYFYPPYTITNAFMEVPYMTDGFINSSGINHLTIKGINFKASRGHGLNIANSEDFIFDGCRVENVGMNAINLQNNTRARIINNDFFHIGAKGIEISGGDRITLTSSENLIENNHFFNYAKIWPTNNPGINLNGVGTTIQHNVFHESSSQGVWFSGNDHKINYNEFYNLVKEASDAGAIYAGRNYTCRGNEIAYNYIHDIDTSADKSGSIYVAAVYLDDMFSSANVHHNVIARCHLGVMIGGGRDNFFDNNLIIDCANSMFMDGRGVGWAAYHAVPGGQAYNTIFAVPYDDAVWSSRYPELADIFKNGKLGLPWNNSIQNNLIYNCKSKVVANEMITYGTVENNTETNENPGFKDYENDNFEIAEGSELLKTSPGLKDIDMSKAGLEEERVKETTEKSLNAGFRLIAPRNGEKNISNLGYLFKWDKHDGSDKYVVKIAEDPEMKNVVIEEESVNNWLDIRNIPTGEKIFYWTVEGINFSQNLKNRFSQIGAPRMFASYQYELTDRTQLENDIMVCQTLYDKMAEGTEPGTYKAGFKSKVKQVLDKAKAINNSVTSLQNEIDMASEEINNLIADIYDNFNYEVVNVGEFLKDKANWKYSNADKNYYKWNEDGSLTLSGEEGRKNHYSIMGYDKDLGRATAIKFGYKVNVSSNYCIMGLQPVINGFLAAGKGYNIIIKSNAIEIQKYVPGYSGNAIKQQILNFYISDDKWVDLEMGALLIGVGTYVYLKADGNIIASFLDTDPPYWDPEAVKFIFTNPSGEMPECVASIRAAKE